MAFKLGNLLSSLWRVSPLNFLQNITGIRVVVVVVIKAKSFGDIFYEKLLRGTFVREVSSQREMKRKIKKHKYKTKMLLINT